MKMPRIVLVCLFLLLPFAAAGCGDSQADLQAGGEGADDSPAEIAREADASARELLAKKETVAEARKWLTEDEEKHALWKVDRKTVSGLVNDLYEAGSPQVFVVDIGREGDVEIAANFVAELPSDAAKRKKVIATHNAFWKKHIEDEEELEEFVIEDHGQKYLLIGFDL